MNFLSVRYSVAAALLTFAAATSAGPAEELKAVKAETKAVKAELKQKKAAASLEKAQEALQKARQDLAAVSATK